MHGSSVTACAVLDGGPATWLLSADAHGRLMCHNVSRHLSIAAQALTSFAREPRLLHKSLSTRWPRGCGVALAVGPCALSRSRCCPCGVQAS
jgi:hypothetical protein